METDKTLVLVDFEQEWIDHKSEYYVGDISEVIARVNQLLDHCRAHDYKIIFTRHIEPDDPNAFVENTNAVEIISGVNKQPDDVLITKYRISPFYNTNLDDELAGVSHIVTAGILTNLCVRSLVQDAYDRDFDITVISDCCVAFDQETHNFTLKDLKETREEVEVMELEEFFSKEK